MKNLTAETRRRGESRRKNTPAFAQTMLLGPNQPSNPVILSGAPPCIVSDATDGRGVEGSRRSVVLPCSIKAFSRELPASPSIVHTSSGSFDSHPNARKPRASGTPDSPSLALGLAQDDRRRLVRRVLRILISVLREIFDENAYERFLLRTRSARSVSSYRDFLREREAGIARKPRCC
jgi:hypothetical protein